MHALGFHYLIELKECDASLLKDADYVETALKEAINISGATKIGEIFHRFSPQGISGVILISESHFSIHTWPEHQYAALDLFSCDEHLKIQQAYQFLVKKFKAKTSNITEIRRGILE